MTPEEKTKRILALEGQLARCENEKHQLEREIARLRQMARRRAKRKVTKK